MSINVDNISEDDLYENADMYIIQLFNDGEYLQLDTILEQLYNMSSYHYKSTIIDMMDIYRTDIALYMIEYKSKVLHDFLLDVEFIHSLNANSSDDILVDTVKNIIGEDVLETMMNAITCE